MKQHVIFGHFIRIAPIVILVTTVLKMYFLSNTPITITNVINVILNAFMLWMVYFQGVTLNYCWKHRSLCRTAAWEYAYYLTISITIPPNLDNILIFNMLFVVLLLIYYKFV